MKKLTIILVSLLVLFLIIPPLLPLDVKKSFYAQATDFEASMLGFEQHTANIGEMDIVFYTNAAENDERPAMLMLHGYSADKDAWPRFAANLAESYQIVIPDMAGHGDTGFSKTWSYSAPAQADRMARLLDKLNISKVHVIGNSMGGFISAHFALSYPDRTLSAVLIDPAGVVSPQPSDMDKLLAQGKNPFEINNREEFDSFFAMTMAEPPWIPDMLLDAAAAKYMERKAELTHIFADFYKKDMLDASLKDIQAPVLLLWGDKDQLIHVSSVDVWAAGVSNIKTQVWEGIGHLPMMEIPKESAEAVASFISAL